MDRNFLFVTMSYKIPAYKDMGKMRSWLWEDKHESEEAEVLEVDKMVAGDYPLKRRKKKIKQWNNERVEGFT